MPRDRPALTLGHCWSAFAFILGGRRGSMFLNEKKEIGILGAHWVPRRDEEKAF